ncbi:MAG TPA: ferredoxin [Desulfosporosinus sp.]|nr:ferredoxin [Desulfosporosinus sp.]
MVNNNNVSEGCSCCSDCDDTTLKTQTVTLDSCSCGPGCCDAPKVIQMEKKRIIIDFLFLDVSVCTRCQGADTSLEEALSEVSKVLEATGVEVLVNKINVVSEELANQYKFISSPTIRVNGRDIQMDIKESLCESCGDLCGDEVDCRVWVYQGNEYSVPPKAMIIEALLKEVYGGTNDEQKELEYSIPDNLKKFYAAMKNK